MVFQLPHAANVPVKGATTGLLGLPAGAAQTHGLQHLPWTDKERHPYVTLSTHSSEAHTPLPSLVCGCSAWGRTRLFSNKWNSKVRL